MRYRDINSTSFFRYPMERMDADGLSFHKTCMKCVECGCTLRLGNYASLAGKYYW